MNPKREGCRFRSSLAELAFHSNLPRGSDVSSLVLEFPWRFSRTSLPLVAFSNLNSPDKLRGFFCGKDDFQKSVQGDFPPRHQWRYCIRSLRYPLSRFWSSFNLYELTKIKTSKTTRGSALMMKEWVRKKKTTESQNKIRKFATLLISNVEKLKIESPRGFRNS